MEDNLRETQDRNGIRHAPLDWTGDYLTLDTWMETGVGKTFAFINAIFELHKRHGLTHFVIIVPSIAIKEGVKTSFNATSEYFQRQYGRRVDVHEMSPARARRGRTSPPSGLMSFIASQRPAALLMTNHAFNSKNNVINQELEGFFADYAKTPMEALAARHPVLIIDEPQRVEGGATTARLKDFSPLFALRYSATFRPGQIKNLIYVLDSYDAFEKKLVKGVVVTDYQTGPTDSAFLGARRFVGREVELEAAAPDGKPLRVRVGVEGEGDGKLCAKTKNPDYRGLRVSRIDRAAKTVSFSDGKEPLKIGEYIGRSQANEDIIAEVMLRDTIDRHLRKESELFRRGIKCLSLIFIDSVRDYRDYDADNGAGPLQAVFERCYEEIKKALASELPADYLRHIGQWTAADAHGGYFSGDAKRNRKIDAGAAVRDNEDGRALQREISDLILRDKEKILDPGNKLRFIFAHSALREGWDNPNVFQICKLRSAYSQTGIAQEVGRGLRICVNAELARQDEDAIGGDFSAVNRLHVFTLGNGEFIGNLQKDLSDRRSERKVNSLSRRPAPDVADGRDEGGKEARPYRASSAHYEKFEELWRLLHRNVRYEVRYSDDFARKAAAAIDEIEDITTIRVIRKTAAITAKGGEFGQNKAQETTAPAPPLASDLPARAFLCQLAEKTKLPRNSVVHILSGVCPGQYEKMRKNPHLAAEKAATAIQNLIKNNIMENIRYVEIGGMRESEAKITLTDKRFFAQRYIDLSDLPDIPTNSLWEEIAPYDSDIPEREITENALGERRIAVFAKLPRAVNIPAPFHPKGVNPDFAVVIDGADERRLYFVAEAKPMTDAKELRLEERRRVELMRRYFAAVNAGGARIKFDVISGYAQLNDILRGVGGGAEEAPKNASA